MKYITTIALVIAVNIMIGQERINNLWMDVETHESRNHELLEQFLSTEETDSNITVSINPDYTITNEPGQWSIHFVPQDYGLIAGDVLKIRFVKGFINLQSTSASGSNRK